MLVLLSRFWFSLRFALLTATVLLVLGLNQRAVSILRPVGKEEVRLDLPTRATVVKQKVLLEATTLLDHFVAPPAVACGPARFSGRGCWPWRCRRRHPSFNEE
jgi:hypothetical protein